MTHAYGLHYGKITLRLTRGAMLRLAVAAACGFAQASALAQSPAATQPADASKTDSYMRVVDQKNKSIELQIATRDLTRIDDKPGPRVGLVGVAHIGDKSFYREVQKLLTEYDVVLYESVKPEGTTKPGGDTAEERIDSTRASMRFVGGLVESYRHENNTYPANVDALKEFAGKHDPRLAQFLAAALVDAWGTPLLYVPPSPSPSADNGHANPPRPAEGEGRGEGAAPQASGPKPQASYTLLSLGADHIPGGEGENADLNLGDEVPPDPMELSRDDGLQSQLASALGLEFQLDALDYSPANWRCSDMAMDEVNRRLQAKGLDFEVLGGTLAGSSLPAKFIKLLLGVMKVADSFMEGAIADTFKVAMIELLGDPTLVDVSLNQLGQGFGEVIINDRNQIPINDLKAIIEHEPEVKSVAILYGAGHMNLLQKQLCEQLHYVPVIAADGGEHWHTAIKVDLAHSAVSPREITQIRMMIRQMIKQQMGAR